jgi:hypothetical protein
MINLYWIGHKKFIKWTDNKCEFECYTDIEEIRSFSSYVDNDGNSKMCFRLKNNDPYIQTSYKWCDFENYVKEVI